MADSPRPRGGPSAVKSSKPPETKEHLWSLFKLTGGPSAPQGRTVRHSNATARNTFNVCQRRPFEPWRTVRAPGADHPQLKVSHHQRQTTSPVQNSQRPADRPRPRGGPSTVEHSFPPETIQISGTLLISVVDRPLTWV